MSLKLAVGLKEVVVLAAEFACDAQTDVFRVSYLEVPSISLKKYP